ncbi:MAG: LamG domain-containing protein [Planctomycetota bacterium]|jgi:hypothetical protein
MEKKKKTSLVIAVVFVVMVVTSSVWADLTDGLIAHWKFDEGSGSTANDSAGSNDGTIYGAQWSDGALDFDGSDDCVIIPDSSVFDFGNGDFSIGLWFKTDGPSNPWGEQFMLVFRQNDNSPHIEIYTAGGRLGTHLLPNSARITDGYAEDGKWHHAAITMDNGASKGYKLYMDGVKVGERTYSGILSNWDTLKIGGDFQGPGNGRPEFFHGLIDDVTIFDRTLSGDEVLELYRGEFIGLEITGPDTVADNFQAQYKAIANYERADVDVTGLADWSVDDETIASIAAGLLTTEMVDLPTDITITAEYTKSENTEAAQKQVSILTICPSGTALDFDGLDDYVNVSNETNFDFERTDSFSILLWAKLSEITFFSPIISKESHSGNYRGYEMRIIGDKLRIILRNSFQPSNQIRVDSTISLFAERWYYLGFTYDGSSEAAGVKMYINGFPETVSIASNDLTGSILNNVPITIGSRTGGGDFFNGVIDDVRIYDRALSGEEIWVIMHTRPESGDPNLVGYWDFDEGEGQAVYDISGTGNDGQLGSGPGEDDSDPAWVWSDAPVGICTAMGLVERNLLRVFDMKETILEILEDAMGTEDATKGFLDELFESGEIGDLKKGDIAKAKQKIHSAIQ